jgi:hypothetical protein
MELTFTLQLQELTTFRVDGEGVDTRILLRLMDSPCLQAPPCRCLLFQSSLPYVSVERLA